jgi:hypothetical protein
MLGEILRLDSLIADCLDKTQDLKSVVVKLSQYECAAQLREIEKEFTSIRENLSRLPYPAIPSKGLTRNGAIYSTQLFNYCQSRDWKNIPDQILKLVVSRRNEVNETFKFDNGKTDFFKYLNARFKTEEDRINNFIASLLEVYNKNNLDTLIDDFSYGGIVIQFLTSQQFYRSCPKEGAARWCLYEIEIPIDDWIVNLKTFQDKPEIDYDNVFFKYLPVELLDQQICFLFSFVGNNGLLALQDMINIDNIRVSFPFLCRLKRILT